MNLLSASGLFQTNLYGTQRELFLLLLFRDFRLRATEATTVLANTQVSDLNSNRLEKSTAVIKK